MQILCGNDKQRTANADPCGMTKKEQQMQIPAE
jgi:hypothetical protein